MFKKLFKGSGKVESSGSNSGAQTPTNFSPYRNPAFNTIYNLLFCDDVNLFRTESKKADGPWEILLAEKADIAALKAIAENTSQESRVRMLAYNRMRENKEPVPTKKLLGVIVEVGLDNGLDVLAAFVDDRVRYINQFEKLAVFEPATGEIKEKAQKLMAVSQPVVNQIGPWDKMRLPPPSKGALRMTFLVSDGLYFGQGPLADMEKEHLAGPIITAGVELIQAMAKLQRKS